MLILILVMGGCSQITPSLNQQSTSISSNLVFTPTSSDKGQTQTKTITATKTSPAPKPTVFATEKVLPTFTPTSVSTLTPLPTLSQRDAHDLIQALLQNNGGCRLPCWWGITPGQTDWNTARQFLDTFVIDIKQSWEEKGEEQGSPTSRASYDIYYESEGGEKPAFMYSLKMES